MATMQVFVSHSHEDDAFCRAVVTGLREAGADVWYDEHNLGSGQLMEVIQRELGRRPVVILILSKAAFASRWVRREIAWAYELLDRDPSRLLLPVTAGPIAREDFSPENGWLFLHDFKRIEASGYLPYPAAEAVRRLLHTLALTRAGEASVPTVPQPSESVDDLVERGKALKAQMRYAEALLLVQRATDLAPSSFDAWFNLGYILAALERYSDALHAYDRALALDTTSPAAWNNKGAILRTQQQYQAALAAYNRALVYAPDDAVTWYNKGIALDGLRRYDEALAAYNHALALDPTFALAWNNKGNTLRHLLHYDKALDAYDRALALDPGFTFAWFNKGRTLEHMQRYRDALNAYDRGFDRDNAMDWRAHARVYRALGRTAEAEEAERRAKELGG